MVKLYSLKSACVIALAVMANVAVGQNIKVTSHGNPVSNGDVIELPYELEDFSEYGEGMANYTWNPHLEASTTEGSVAISVAVSADDKANGVSICWPTQCVMVNPGSTVTANGTIDTTPADLQTHREVFTYSLNDVPTEEGNIKVEVTSDTETIGFTIKCLLKDANGVGENLADDNAVSEYYTIQGIRVAEPQKGQLYIERKGQKVVKRIF